MSKSLLQYAAQYDPAVQGLAQTINNTSILMGLVPVEKVEGLVHRFGTVTYEGGVSTRALNAPFPTTPGSTIAPGAERVIIAGRQSKCDVRMERARPDEITRATRAVSRFIDYQLLRGAGLTNQEKLVGLEAALVGDQVVINVTNGAVLDLDRFDAMLDAVEDQGAGRFVVMNRKTARQLKQELVTDAGGASFADLTGVVGEYEGVKLIVAGKDHNGDELLPFTETCGTSEVTCSAYCFAPGPDSEEKSGFKILMASNGIQLINEGIRDSQYVDTVEVAFGRAIYHPRCVARLMGIAAAS